MNLVSGVLPDADQEERSRLRDSRTKSDGGKEQYLLVSKLRALKDMADRVVQGTERSNAI